MQLAFNNFFIGSISTKNNINKYMKNSANYTTEASVFRSTDSGLMAWVRG